MASKTYIPKPIDAFQYKNGDAAQSKELEKLGVTFNEFGTRVTGPTGNELDINDGDYIAVDATNDIRVYGKEYFEGRYVEFKK